MRLSRFDGISAESCKRGTVPVRNGGNWGEVEVPQNAKASEFPRLLSQCNPFGVSSWRRRVSRFRDFIEARDSL